MGKRRELPGGPATGTEAKGHYWISAWGGAPTTAEWDGHLWNLPGWGHGEISKHDVRVLSPRLIPPGGDEPP